MKRRHSESPESPLRLASVNRVTQTFCRHNRFIQRCPICRETVPGLEPPPAPKRTSSAGAGTRGGGRPAGSECAGRRHIACRGAARPTGRTYTRRTQEVRVQREARAEDDGYRCDLVPGLHSSEDAKRLVREIGFASGRLLTLTAAPPSLYAEARDFEDIEQATWMCFLAAYLSPLQGEQPFAGCAQRCSPVGPPARPSSTKPHSARAPPTTPLVARRHWSPTGASPSTPAPSRPHSPASPWTPQRRFERVFERLALPGFGRMGRYDLLITLGRLGLYELRADSLHLGTRTSLITSDPTPPAAKRVFGIGDPIHIERRATALAHAMDIPIEALDLAFANWSSEERVTLGFPEDTSDPHAVERAAAALEV